MRKIKTLLVLFFLALAIIFASLRTTNAVGNELILQTASGADLFRNNCARCHADDGTGGKGPDLTSEKRQARWKESDEKLVKKITKGGFFMPSFGKKLKPDEIKAIAAHVRTLK